MAATTILRLEVPSRMQALDAAHEVVDRSARALGFDHDARQDIQAAVHECLVNAIVHGNEGDEEGRVALEVVLRPDRVEVRIRDEGRGIDPALVPDPLNPENLSKPSGRGILLMRALMDGVDFRRLPNAGTEVTLSKRLPRAATNSVSKGFPSVAGG